MKSRAVFASVALWLLAAGATPLFAHPGVGIVMDSRDNVFSTDLERVWKIAPDGSKTVAVGNVHTHAARVRHVAGFRTAASAAPAAMSAGERAACSRALDEATGSTARALAAFENGKSADVAAGRAVLAAATADRNRLEATAVSPSCARSRAEELVYLNHLTLGFQGWIAARSRRPPGDYDLASIVRRARVHRERGRERLRSP